MDLSSIQTNDIIFIAMIILFLFRGKILGAVFGIPVISVNQLEEGNYTLIDVRTVSEFSSGHAPKANNLPLHELKNNKEHILNKYNDKNVAVICRTGNRSLIGSIQLKRMGLKSVSNVRGGMTWWQAKIGRLNKQPKA
jgi:rhodanese-related sulfurtransferase